MKNGNSLTSSKRNANAKSEKLDRLISSPETNEKKSDPKPVLRTQRALRNWAMSPTYRLPMDGLAVSGCDVEDDKDQTKANERYCSIDARICCCLFPNKRSSTTLLEWDQLAVVVPLVALGLFEY